LSRHYIIFKSNHLLKDDFHEFIRSYGGGINGVGHGFFKNNNAIIWISYGGDKLDKIFYKNELALMNKKYNTFPDYDIVIEASNYGNSKSLALDFCKNFMSKYSDTVLYDNNGNYYSSLEIKNLKNIK